MSLHREPAVRRRMSDADAACDLMQGAAIEPAAQLLAGTPLPEVTVLPSGEGWLQWNLAVQLLDGPAWRHAA